MIQPEPVFGERALKRYREDVCMQDQQKMNTKANKIPNQSKPTVYDFNCSAYYKNSILDFQLSQVFHTFRYAILFFCHYDFSPQSKEDLHHIQSRYSNFIEFKALPIVITHDRAQIHQAYATPGKTVSSLEFAPSFLMASDGTDRLISRAFKVMNQNTNDMQRSVIIINHDLEMLFSYSVPDKRFFPMKAILDCFKQAKMY